MTKEEIEKQIREAVLVEARKTDYLMVPGIGVVMPWTLKAMTGLIMPLYDKVDRLRSLLLLDKQETTVLTLSK